MNNTKSHAQRELDILIKTTPDAVIRDFVPEILALCEAFGNSGQSGGSAPYVASALSHAIKKLCLHQTIAPLTGEDDEWMEVSDSCFQNKRQGDVFKNKDGESYYLDAIVWQGQDDYDSFVGGVEGIRSRQFIKNFPFTPKTFRIDVIREEYDKEKHGNTGYVICGSGNYVYTIKDKSQLKEVFDYYKKLTK